MVRKNPKVRVVKAKNVRGGTRSSISRGRRSTSVAAITSKLRRR